MAQTEEVTRDTPTFSPVELTDIPEISRQGKAQKVVQEFLDSGLPAALMDEGSHKPSFAASLKRYVKDNSSDQVEVVTRQKKIYLRRKDV